MMPDAKGTFGGFSLSKAGSKMKNLSWKRVLMTIFGVTLCGISVGIFKKAALGTDPFTCIVTGFSNVSGLTFGTIYTIFSIVLLIGVFFLNRHYIGLATVFNMLLSGFIVDGCLYVLDRVIIEPSYLVRFGLMLAAILLNCFSSSMYYTADLGVSVYDAYALILGDKKVAPFQYCRIGTDVLCVLVGMLCGAWPGIGTLITAFFMGPIIVWFNIHFSRPLLQGRLWKRG